jgi:hypothetical protein
VKSKWLDWTPSSKIMEQTAKPEPTKPTKPGFVGFVGSAAADLCITRDSKSPSNRAPESYQSEPRVANQGSFPGDPYAERLGAAMREVARPDYPAGMIPWLGEAHPVLYAELTEGLPNAMQRLWSAHAPLEDFDRIIGLWLEAHQTACGLFKAAGQILRRGS